MQHKVLNFLNYFQINYYITDLLYYKILLKMTYLGVDKWER